MEAIENLSIDGVDGARMHLDNVSYNIRKIFHGFDDKASSPGFSYVDVTERLVKLTDQLIYIVERVTHNDVLESDLPKLNSMLSALRYVSKEIEDIGHHCKPQIAMEYHNFFQDRVEDLNEVIDDAEVILFELPQNQEFQEAAKRLFAL